MCLITKFFLAFILCFAFCDAQNNPTVTTKLGKIAGETVSVLNQTIYQFKSIPYANPPIGALRFKKPEPVKAWKGVFNATINGPVCFQADDIISREKMSEDCLLLNIWSPNISSRANQPVMFWLHGGGFNTGGANQLYSLLYSGAPLATRGVVVVAINYRLHNLGFLYSKSKEAPGNVGLHDQVSALKWVQQHISAFGGDPRQVTIFGESAGSFSVGWHVLSPLSKNLFKRAIMQSGSPYYFHGNALNTTINLEVTRNLAKQFNCTGKLDNQIKCLRKADPFKLVTAKVTSTPVVGDDFNPTSPILRMRRGDFNPTAQILAGVTANEGSLFVKGMLGKAPNKEKIRSFLEQFNRVEARVKMNTNELFNHYFGNLTNNEWNNTDLVKKLAADLVGDFALVCPPYLQVEDYAKKSSNNTAYFYIVAYKSDAFKTFIGCDEPWMGVCHAEELPFVFGAPFRINFLPWSARDRQMSILMMYYWTNFAKTGNPFSSKPPADLKVKGLEEWPKISWIKYQPKSGGAKPMKLNPDKIEYFDNPWKKNCDGFWRRYIQ